MGLKTLIFNPPFWGGYLAVLALFLLGVSFSLYKRGQVEKRRLPVLILAAFSRSLVLLILVWLLARPSLEETREIVKLPRLAILLDASASMNLPQAQGEENHSSRWQAVVKTIKEIQENQLLKKFRLEYYTFGKELKPVGGKELSLFSKISAQTNFSNVFQQLYAQSSPDLAAVLLFTDGQDTSGKIESEWGEALKKLGKPVFVVGLGEEKINDSLISSVHTIGTAYLDQPLEINVALANNHLPAEKIKLSLKEEENLLWKQEVMLPKDGSITEKKISFTPHKAGWHKYQVAFEPPVKDAVSENNQEVFYVNIIKEKLEVLLLSGSLDWELSFLTRFMEKKANLAVTSISQGLKGKFFYRDKAAGTLKTSLKEELAGRLKNYDLIIINNLSFASLDETLTEELEKLIMEGKSLLILGGDSAFGAGGYKGTVLANMSPLVIENSHDFVNEEVYLHLIPQWLGNQEGEGESNWKNLPALDGYNEVKEIKKGAELIAYNVVNKTPLIARQFYGTGKVIAVAARGSWHWDFWVRAFEEKAEDYEKFWREIISWLLTFKEESSSLESDRHVYQLGEEVNLTFKAKNPEDTNNLKAQIIKSGSPSSELDFTLKEKDVFSAHFYPQATGDYYIKIKQTETRFTVVNPQTEFLKPAANPANWKFLAASSKGKVFSLERLAVQITEIPAEKMVETQKTQVNFLDFWQIFLLLVVLLGGEWLLQKFLGI